uniref:Polynucleotide 5'-hydroxyl-kinase NOL9 n=1 Tax=Anopheles dirus TaxID=7168 RepID=A0A182NMI5_9DIPT
MPKKNRAKNRAASDRGMNRNSAKQAHQNENEWTISKNQKPRSTHNQEDAPPVKRSKLDEKNNNKAELAKPEHVFPTPSPPQTVQVVKCDIAESMSDSDSDDDDYIAKFFVDTPATNGKNAQKKAASKKADTKQTKVIDGWFEEENDCTLTCDPEKANNLNSKKESKTLAEAEADKKQSSDANTMPSTKGRLVAYKKKQPDMASQESMSYEDSDFDSDDLGTDDDDSFEDGEDDGEEGEEEEDEADIDSDDYGSTDGSDDYYYESEEMSGDDEFGSGTSDDENDTEALHLNDYLQYMSGHPYESDSDDKDYVSTKVEDNSVVVPNGAAVIQDVNDDTILFDNSVIIELPADYGVEKMTSDIETSPQEDAPVEEEAPMEAASMEDTQATKTPVYEADLDDEDDDAESNSSCPQLVDMLPPASPASSVPSAYTFYDAIDLRMSLAVLKSPIYVYGHLSVQALFGKIEMMGYQFSTAEKRTVYASGGYNAINITPIPSPEAFDRTAFERILAKLKPHFVESDICRLAELFDPDHSALVLLRADNFDDGDAIVPVVSKLLPDYNLFPSTLPLNRKSPFRSTETLLEIAIVVPGQVATRIGPQFQHNPVWDAIPLSRTTRLMVMGGKGSGKSTLCQYLINRHVNQFGRVVLLDLDIGQPLLFVPETISVCVVQEPILGVGYFANVKPHKCHLFGSLNVVSSPHVYLQNVRSLVKYCSEDPELKNVPWIINTMGYVSGFGEELTAALVRVVQPTALLQLTIPKNFKQTAALNKPQNYSIQLTDAVVNAYKFNILKEEADQQPDPVKYTFHPVDVVYEPSSASFLPPKRRTIAILVQLVKILGDSCESFTDVKPHSAHLNDLSILITRDEYKPTKEKLQRVLDAALVYLCEKLENGHYNCHGVGIVRAVDEKENVYLLSSLTAEQLAKTNVLAICNTSLPSQVLLQQDVKIEGTIPFLQNMSSPQRNG